jgi:2-oxoglutarate ferredoxin oxidoreductase subunit alpha
MNRKSGTIHFWQGNEACAEGAIAAGCRFFAGYPITPASEIAETMAARLPRIGGTYLQMEDEIGAIAAVIGSSWGGKLSMTATSGPGFSLMQENIGYAIMTETPCVIVDVQRAGPSTGQATKVGQGDFMQSRWGSHGDYESIVLAPNSSQETYELTIKAFELSEKFRHPVILLSDEIVAHSRERVIIDEKRNRSLERDSLDDIGASEENLKLTKVGIMPKFGDGHDLLITGSTHDEKGYRRTSDAETHDNLIRRITAKIRENSHFLKDFDIMGPARAEWGVISFGSTSRSVEEIIESGDNAIRSFRLKTIWPFPDDELLVFSKTVERLLVPELNLGQLYREVTRVVDNDMDVVPLNKVGGGLMIRPDEILEAVGIV